MKKLIAILAAVLIINIAFPSCAAIAAERVGAYIPGGDPLVLVIGLDDAADNSDVIMAVRYSGENNRISVVQIPRDTYLSAGTAQNKINQLTASARARGIGREEALSRLTGEMSSVLGAELDGYVAFTPEGFVHIVDSVGGVDMTLPEDYSVPSDMGLSLRAGENHLDGESAARFIRYRAGYSSGDIGRLDAQKIFMEAFRKKLTSLSLPEIISLLRTAREYLITNIPLGETVAFATRSFRKLKSAAATYLTLPGEPAMSDTGVSYYVVCRAAAERVVRDYLLVSGGFDPQRRLLNPDIPEFAEIYYREKTE